MFSTILSWLTVAFFLFWFGVSVINQHKRWRRVISKISSRDICSLVPIWTFFAPNPGRTDLYLLYRDRDIEGNISAWREMRLTSRNSWLRLWSPSRRIQKGIVDLAPNFTKDKVENLQQSVSKRHTLEFQYLLLLNYVCNEPVDFRAQMRQFALARTNGHDSEDQPNVIFLSAFHQIDHLN